MGGFTPQKSQAAFFVLSRNGEEQCVTKRQRETGQRSHFRTEEAKFIPKFYQVEDLKRISVGRETSGFPLQNMAVTIAV